MADDERVPRKKSEEEDSILRCPQCDSARLREKLGELICQECGTVLDENRAKKDASRRAFTQEEREKVERTGSPITYTKPGRGLKTEIGSGSMNEVSPEKRGQYYRIKKWQRRLDESSERRMKMALREMERLVDVLGLPESVTEEAARLYEKALEEGVVKGRKIEAVVAALLYLVARNHGVPRTMSEIADEADVSERRLGKTYRYVARELDLRIVPVNPEDFVARYSSKLGLEGEIQALARSIIQDARDQDLIAGRSPDSVVASAIYLATLLEDREIAQKEIADEVGVTEVTIRKGYQNLVEGLGLEKELE